jgi:hypothetical protein
MAQSMRLVTQKKTKRKKEVSMNPQLIEIALPSI